MARNDRFEIKCKTPISRTTIHGWSLVLFGLPSEEIYRTRLKERPPNYWELKIKAETDGVVLVKKHLSTGILAEIIFRNIIYSNVLLNRSNQGQGE